jgi:hypothetical protein
MKHRTAAAVIMFTVAIVLLAFAPVVAMNVGYCAPIPLEGPHVVSLSYYAFRFGLVYGQGHLTFWGWGWCAGEA